MVFSIISAAPMFIFYQVLAYSIAYPFHGKFVTKDGLMWELIILPFILTPCLLGSPIEKISVTDTLLFGMTQSSFLCNLFMFIQFNFGWGINYARLMAFMFSTCSLIRFFYFETILIPKFPIKTNWLSIAIITLSFTLIGYLSLPYCTNLMLFLHFYVYLLSIETSTWYFTEEFRLFSKPRHHCSAFNKAYFITVHRNK
ncbi:hypothetical protein CRE_13451 [Caenorhabditis remanei]|uniref:Uncharacterized protein n=1 Tax=Caenorhabditis remanei TaxID=31234 RepID=E3MR17_CAERE|nr:hypothetical protein CRE_13451 [Caenorhabditis remanei]